MSAGLLIYGRFRLERQLAGDARGTLWQAVDTRGGGRCSVKLLSDKEAANEASRSRFLKGGRALHKLEHPNLVRVLAGGQDGDRVFLVTELLSGGSLQERVDRLGPLPARVACEAVLALLSGLELAHHHNVVHRNINPENILVSDTGVPKLTDFGLAFVDEGPQDARMTVAGVFMGSWAYNSPEQRRSALLADARSDIYSVGATLYTLVVGKRPPDLYLAEFQPQVLEELPTALQPVVRGATTYQPEERYATAGALRTALEGVLPALPRAAANAPTLRTPLA